MSDPDPGGLPASPEPPPLAAPTQPERVPFWGYFDLVLFAGLAVFSLLVGTAALWLAATVLRLNVRFELIQIPGQFVGYLILFLCMRLMFLARYGQPFWKSMGWTEPGMRTEALLGLGVLLAMVVLVASVVLKTPETPTPMTRLLADRNALIMVAVFGMTLGPLCEELIFRGFLQPLLVRSLGVAAGIVLAAVPFGLLHLPEYGYAWQPGFLVTVAGTAFGWIRYRTGSTRAATIMHMAYNSTFFVMLLLQRKSLPHT